jgi:hypothetical protein
VPRLVRSAWERNIEADLYNLVLRPKQRLASGNEPGVGSNVDEAADPLGLDFDIKALWPPRQGAAGTAFASSKRSMISA